MVNAEVGGMTLLESVENEDILMLMAIRRSKKIGCFGPQLRSTAGDTGG